MQSPVNGVLEGQASVGVGLDYGTRPVFVGSSGEAVYDGKLNGVIEGRGHGLQPGTRQQ